MYIGLVYTRSTGRSLEIIKIEQKGCQPYVKKIVL